jgi:hypothetical protein
METGMAETNTTGRELTDDEGVRWSAFADDAIVAHGRVGAALAFSPVSGQPGDIVRTTLTFNSAEAADFALRTMSEKELRRRLTLARMAAGGM